MGQEQLSIAGEAFIRWVVRTKKLIPNPKSPEAKEQLLECTKDENLNKEFALIFHYLQDVKKSSIEYLKEGIYNFSGDEFKGFLDYLATNNSLPGHGAIDSKVYSTIFKEWSNAKLSFDISSYGKHAPIYTAIANNNLEFITALNQVSKLSFLKLNLKGLSPVVQLVKQIQDGSSNIKHLQSWINLGLPLNTRCSQDHKFSSALDFARNNGLEDIAKLLDGKYVNISPDADSSVKYENDVEFTMDLFEALKKYLAAFNTHYDFQSVLKTLSPKTNIEQVELVKQQTKVNGFKQNITISVTAEKPIYNSADFKKDFQDIYNLQHFISFIRADNELDSTIADKLEEQLGISQKIENQDSLLVNAITLVKESDELDSAIINQINKSTILEKRPIQDPNKSLQFINHKEGELLKKYLQQFKLEINPNNTHAQKSIDKLNAGKFNEIDLNDDTYKFLLNYCVLNLEATDENISLFRGLLGKVGCKGLKYSHGYQPFDGQNFYMTSDLSPLGIATYVKHDSASKFACILAEYGYGTSDLDFSGVTIVHLAAAAGNIPLIEMLKDVPGVDFNQKSQDGLLPIIHPLVQCSGNNTAQQVPIIKALIAGGSDINYVDSDGDTILHLFVREGLLEQLKTAKDLGANFDILNGEGNTLIECAKLNNKMEVFIYLLTEQAKANGQLEVLKFFQDQGIGGLELDSSDTDEKAVEEQQAPQPVLDDELINDILSSSNNSDDAAQFIAEILGGLEAQF